MKRKAETVEAAARDLPKTAAMQELLAWWQRRVAFAGGPNGATPTALKGGTPAQLDGTR